MVLILINPSAQDFSNAEKFMARMYNSTKDILDKVRVTALLSSNEPEHWPPTSNAAHYHLRRSLCQAAKLLHTSDNFYVALPLPKSCGGFWDEEGHFVPIMMTTEPMPAMQEEIMTCQCLGSCEAGRCKCKKSGMKCTLLCHKNSDTIMAKAWIITMIKCGVSFCYPI